MYVDDVVRGAQTGQLIDFLFYLTIYLQTVTNNCFENTCKSTHLERLVILIGSKGSVLLNVSMNDNV